jgi:N-acetyl-anhydromuramyl-L-alanine amidase AmpD
MLLDARGWLTNTVLGEPRVVLWPSTRTSALEVPYPLGVVWHWTAGRGGPGFAEGCCREIQTYDQTKDRAASWHFLVAKNGTIHQSVPTTSGAWHVGRPGTIGQRVTLNINRCTIGVELENAGRLLKLGPKCYCWPFWLNPDATPNKKQPDPRLEVDPVRAIYANGGFWRDAEGGFFDSYTPAQVAGAEALLRTLVTAFKWAPAVCGYGHVMFDFPRKEDPGPLWLQGALPTILLNVFSGRLP